MSNPIPLIVFIIVVLCVVTRCDQQAAIQRGRSQVAHAVLALESPA